MSLGLSGQITIPSFVGQNVHLALDSKKTWATFQQNVTKLFIANSNMEHSRISLPNPTVYHEVRESKCSATDGQWLSRKIAMARNISKYRCPGSQWAECARHNIVITVKRSYYSSTTYTTETSLFCISHCQEVLRINKKMFILSW